MSVDSNQNWTFPGDVIIGTAGKGFEIAEGSNARMGVATLVAGSATVANTSVTANTRIFYSRQAAGGVTGNLSCSKSAGVSFTLSSSSVLDTSTIAWELKEPA